MQDFELPQIPQTASDSKKVAFQKAGSTLKHAYKLMEAHRAQDDLAARDSDLKFQGFKGADRVNRVHAQGVEQLNQLARDTFSQLDQFREPLTKKDIKDLKKVMKASEAAAVSIIHETEISAIQEIAKAEAEQSGYSDTELNTLARRIDVIARGGFVGKVFQYVFSFTDTGKIYEKALKKRERVSHRAPDIDKENLNPAEAAILGRFKTSPRTTLAEKSGAIGLKGIYQVSSDFSPDNIHKQLSAVVAHEVSLQDRYELRNEMTLEGGIAVTSCFTPLNAAFDRSLSVLGKTTSVFGKIFGEKGISSMNRRVSDLINGWQTTLEAGSTEQKPDSYKRDRPSFRALRHGVMAAKYESDPNERQATSKRMARQMLTAAVLQELEDRNASPGSIKTPLEINVSSTGLLTPDFVRALGITDLNERKMLRDQREALMSFQGNQVIEIGEYKVPVKFNIMTFNYGVNAGAVGKLKYGFGIKFGSGWQHDMNVKSLETLNVAVEKHLWLHRGDVGLATHREQVLRLMKDINDLNRWSTAYLESGNQYEIGAKILCLMNLMDHVEGTSCKTAFGCYSAKDRASFLDAAAKALWAVYEVNGEFPTTEQLSSDDDLKNQYINLLIPFIIEGGNLEITEINTEVPGLKVGAEANLWEMITEESFRGIQGLGKLTGQ